METFNTQIVFKVFIIDKKIRQIQTSTGLGLLIKVKSLISIDIPQNVIAYDISYSHTDYGFESKISGYKSFDNTIFNFIKKLVVVIKSRKYKSPSYTDKFVLFVRYI